MRWYADLSLRDPDLRRYLWLSLPIMIGFSIVAVDEWIIKNQASYLGEGVLAYLQYGRTLMKVPIGVFGMAAGVAAYPTISRLVSAGSMVEAYGLLCRAVRLMLVATFAAQVCLTLAGFEAAYLIWGLFAERFSVSDAQSTANILAYLCLGLAGWAAQSVISRGFYALESTWVPTLVGTVVAALMIPLYVALRQQCGAIGLAIASAVAILTYVFSLGWLQRRRFEREAAAVGTSLDGAQGMLGTALRLGLAAAIAVAVGLAGRMLMLQLLPGVGAAIVILRAALICGLGLSVYLALARGLGVRDLIEFESALLRRLGMRRPPDIHGALAIEKRQ